MLYLSAQRELGELLDRKCVERLPSWVNLHPAQHHNDDGHDQSHEATGVDDDVGVLGLHGLHGLSCFFFCRNKNIDRRHQEELIRLRNTFQTAGGDNAAEGDPVLWFLKCKVTKICSTDESFMDFTQDITMTIKHLHDGCLDSSGNIQIKKESLWELDL